MASLTGRARFVPTRPVLQVFPLLKPSLANAYSFKICSMNYEHPIFQIQPNGDVKVGIAQGDTADMLPGSSSAI